jgi:transposase
MVTQKGKGIPQAAKRLNIKLSTAKHIIKTFAEKGYLYNKKMHRVETTQNVPSQENSSSKNISSDQVCQPDLVKAEEQP